tara:strand:- start:1411 stop:1638 length:228 start_codon:yes stop_codon:yes gene_type:complete
MPLKTKLPKKIFSRRIKNSYGALNKNKKKIPDFMRQNLINPTRKSKVCYKPNGGMNNLEFLVAKKHQSSMKYKNP